MEGWVDIPAASFLTLPALGAALLLLWGVYVFVCVDVCVCSLKGEGGGGKWLDGCTVVPRSPPRSGRQAPHGSADCQYWAALKAGGARPCSSFLPVSPIKLMSTSTPALWARIAGLRANNRPVLPIIFVPTESANGEWWPDSSGHWLNVNNTDYLLVLRVDGADKTLAVQTSCCSTTTQYLTCALGLQLSKTPILVHQAACTATSTGAVLLIESPYLPSAEALTGPVTSGCGL